MSSNGRASILVRMSGADKERIARAAARERLSLTAWMLRAGLAASRARPQRPVGPDLTPEGDDALTALVASGLSPKEAEAKVAAVILEQPEATADEIVSAAFKGVQR